MHTNLSVSGIHVGIAELYLEAGALEKAERTLEDLLKVFPAYANAKYMLAQVKIAAGDKAAAEELLEQALDAWSEADEDYVGRHRARALADSLGS